ncbi:uncharacterized protein LOC107775864 isoform X3 [Nicotiana tabacum]|uniref:Uncharacterized protein LOC107775864 isoform X3 n=2 Tax=Nicotiana tabacum TaxID=4097 RepID=A0AC58SYE9_TOBAC
MIREPPPPTIPQNVTSSSVAGVRSGDFSDATETPPEKKQKLGEEVDCKTSTSAGDEDGMSSPVKAQYIDGYDSEEEIDEAVWDKYLQQIRESEGFDIKDYPGPSLMVTVFPMPYYLTDPENLVMLKGYAEKALKKYNDTNSTCWEVDDILKVNGEGGRSFIFYITLSVKTQKGEKDYFQAKVVRDLDGHLDFPIVRPQIVSIFAAAGDSCAYCWDVEKNEIKMVLKGHSDYLHCIVERNSHNQVITGSEDGTVRIWELVNIFK